MHTITSQFKKLPRPFYFLLATVLLNRMGFFAVMPFLAIFLKQVAHFNSGLIGTIMIAAPLFYSLTGSYSGYLSDKFGQRHLLVGSMLIGGITMAALLQFINPLWICFCYAIFGATRSAFESSSSALGIYFLGIDSRRLAFSLRYMAINSGAAIGPLIGAEFAAHQSTLIFQLAAIVFILLGFFIYKQNWNAKIPTNPDLQYKQIFKLLIKDRSLRLITCITILFWTAYSQFDITIPQYLYAHFKNGAHLFSLMILINAFLCVTLQIPLTHWLQKIPQLIQALCACLFMILGFIIITVATHMLWFFIASICLTLSEIIIFTINDISIAEISPPDLLTTYLGAAGLGILGLALGPFLGGWIYQYGGFIAICGFCTITMLICASLYFTYFKKIKLSATT